MAKLSCLAKLWDHCVELEAYIRSHTALAKYKLHGQAPETIVLGQEPSCSLGSGYLASCPRTLSMHKMGVL